MPIPQLRKQDSGQTRRNLNDSIKPFFAGHGGFNEGHFVSIWQHGDVIATRRRVLDAYLKALNWAFQGDLSPHKGIYAKSLEIVVWHGVCKSLR